MLKDVRLCLEEAQAAGVAVPGRRGGARRARPPAMGRGLGDADFAALIEASRASPGARSANDICATDQTAFAGKFCDSVQRLRIDDVPLHAPEHPDA